MSRSPIIVVSLALLSLLLTALPPADAANLLINGDFERPDEHGGPANWFSPAGGDHPSAEAKVVAGGYESPQCLMLEGQAEAIPFTVFSPPVEIADLPTRRMLFTCYCRTYDEPRAQISLVTFAQDFRQREWQTPAVQTEVQDIPQSGDWNLLSWYFEAVPGARQAIVVLRITGHGRVYIDRASLRPYPDELSAQIEEAGILCKLPSERQTTLHLTNRSGRERKLQAVLIAVDQQGRSTRAQRQATIAAHGKGLLSLHYRFPLDRPHQLQIIVSDEASGEVYEHQQVKVPGLIEARFRQPSFRGTILSSIPVPHVEIVGRINATEELAQTVKLSAQIAGLALQATEDNGAIVRPAADSFVIQLPLEQMFTGDYTVSLHAQLQDGRYQQALELPLRRLPPSDGEAGYDVRNRLWVRGSPILPRGLFYVLQAEDLTRIAAAGFNLVVVPSRQASYALADKANQLGLSLAVSSPTLTNGEESAPVAGLWHNLQDKFGDNPALLGWYVLPRPDQNSIPPPMMAQLYQDLQQISPDHPTIMALSSPSRLRFYSDFADIIVAWSLPIPDLPITAVAQMVDAACQAVHDLKPVWAAIQASGPGWYRNAGLDIAGPGRPPTAAEVRAMTYLALMHGAKGLIYYAYDIPSYPRTRAFQLPQDAPELWQAMAPLNRELQWLAPVILEGRRALLPPAAQGALELATWEYDEGLYVVAVNTSDQALICHFEVPAAAGKTLQVMFESRQTSASAVEPLPATTNGSFQDSFAPHEVHIYIAR